jgi:hypothetical protein
MSRAGVPASVSGFLAGTEGFANAISYATASLANLNDSLGSIIPIGAAIDAIIPLLTGLGGAVAPVVGGLSTMLAPLGAVTAAVGGQAQAIQDMITQSRVFVQALNPAVIELFDYTVRNLMATIGSGLLPIFTVFTGVIEQISGVIAPVFAQLAPMVEMVATAMGGALLTEIKAVVQLFDIFKPIIQALVAVFVIAEAGFKGLITAMMVVLAPLQIVGELISSILTPALEILNTILGVFDQLIEVVQIFIKTIVDVVVASIVGLFGGGDLRNAINGFIDAVKNMVREMIKFVALLGSLAFGSSFITRLLQGFQPQEYPQAAAQGVNITDLQSIGRQLAQASVLAGAGSRTETSEDYLRQIRSDLQALRDFDRNAVFEEMARIFVRAFADASNRTINSAASTIGAGVAFGPLGLLARAAGGFGRS